MKTTIDYHAKYCCEDEKRVQAIKDVETWLTKSQQFLMHQLIVSGCSYAKYSFLMAIAGIEGFPVAAYWDDLKECMRQTS